MRFKRPQVRYSDTPEPVTPYQAAAQVWDQRIGSARVQAKNWRLMAFGCLSLSLLMASGLVWRSAQSIVTPYVIEVDQAGQVRAVGEAATPYKPSDAQVAFHLARFVTDVRSLSIDPIVVRQSWLEAYDYATDRGAATLNDYARVSYSMDIELLQEGQRAKVFERIINEQGVKFEAGELTTDAVESDLGAALMRFGQALLRLGDLKLWTWHRVSTTFYEDLAQELERIAGKGNVTRNFLVPQVHDAASYPVDFAIRTTNLPLFVFGVPNADKAKLATIILLQLQQAAVQFNSLIVPADIDSIPKADRNRLTNAANDMVTGIDAREPLERKIRQRMG